jgi:hypothetical protein
MKKVNNPKDLANHPPPQKAPRTKKEVNKMDNSLAVFHKQDFLARKKSCKAYFKRLVKKISLNRLDKKTGNTRVPPISPYYGF